MGEETHAQLVQASRAASLLKALGHYGVATFHICINDIPSSSFTVIILGHVSWRKLQ